MIKKKQIKVKGSLERNTASTSLGIQTAPTSTMNVVKLKQIRDARSQEAVGGVIIEK